MSRRTAIKEYFQGQKVLFPKSIDAYIKPDTPVRLISHIVDRLDISLVMDSYSSVTQMLLFPHLSGKRSCVYLHNNQPLYPLR